MKFKLFDLGKVEFRESWQLQKWVFQEIKSGVLDAALIACQHYPVITLGRMGKKSSILISQAELEARGIPIYEIERGGDTTYHGPGQVTLYPIFNLACFKQDIHFFLRRLEDTVINFTQELGVKSQRISGFTGVWVDKKKIASIGIAIKNWITFHGVSINIKSDDLENFRLIKPCGMEIEMTSLETVMAKTIDSGLAKERLVAKLREVFQV
jgi:lipoate-protein ligase B